MLRLELREGMAGGESIEELMARIEPIFAGPRATYRAEMIARTESARASVQGELRSWQESGVVRATIWRAPPDACPYCEAMDGRRVGLGELYFDVGAAHEVPDVGTMRITYEPISGPPLHPNCRCSLEPELIPF